MLSRAEFDRVLKKGVRVSDGNLTLWVLATELPQARLGIMIGRKHGNAVQRNRLKRMLREAFRMRRPEMPAGIDVAASVAPRAPVSVRELEARLMELIPAAVRRIKAGQPPFRRQGPE